MGGVAALRWHARRQTQASFHTPLTGKANWEGDWDLSARGADPSQSGSLAGGNRVTIPFTGTQFALRVRRGDYRAFLWVKIDDRPANRLPQTEQGAYLVLSSPDRDPEVVTLPVASGLDEGRHVAEIVADRGWNQWPLVGWEVTQGTSPGFGHEALRALGAAVAVCLVGLLGCLPQLGWYQETRARQSRENETTPLNPESPGATRSGRAFAPWLSAALLVSAASFYASPWLPLTISSGAALAGLTALRLDLGLALAALSAPFYLHPRPLLGKSFSMLEIITLLCATSWGLKRWIHGGWRSFLPDRLSIADRAVLLLVVAAAISTLFAEHKHVALRELRTVILEPALLYVMVRTTRLDREGTWRIVDAFVAGAASVALIGLVQYKLDINIITAEQGMRRLRSVYGSPNNAALYLGRALPLCLAVAAFARQRWRRLIYGSLIAPLLLGILLTFSRAAIVLGIPLSLLVLGLLAGGRWRWVAVGLALVAGLSAVPLLQTPRFAGLLNPREGTLFFRLQLWRASGTMFQDYPWLGVGPDNFLYQYRGRYILPAAWQEPHLSHAHNILLTFVTRLGLPGLAAGLTLHGAFWHDGLPLRGSADLDRRALGLGLMGSMTYALAHGLVDASFFFVDLAVASLLALGLVQSMRRWHNHEQAD